MLIAEYGKKQSPPSPARGTTPAMADLSLSKADPRWQLVERIAESQCLGKSPLLAKFLRYVCDRQMRGKDAEITEQQIGVKVFGRKEGYNPSDDNIVRSYARTLRKRLEEYFATEGSEEPTLVIIPRGGYVPVFSARETAAPPTSSAPADASAPVALSTANLEALAAAPPHSPVPRFAEPPHSPALETAAHPPPPAKHSLSYGAIALLLLVTAAFGFFAGQRNLAHGLFQSRADRASQQLWSNLFERDRDTFVSPADGGLVMMQSYIRSKVDLAEYISGSYRNENEISRGMQGLLSASDTADQATLTRKVSVLAARRYTSVVDLDLATRLARLTVVPERLVIRFARDLRIDDLRTGNAVLIGSSDANPWVSLFEPQLNFQFQQGIEFGGSGTILNLHPLRGEHARYASSANDPEQKTYGVLAYLPNLDNNGHVLLIEGVNMAGTQAAGDFLLRPDRMQPILQRAMDAQGHLRPFEVLIATRSIGANASTSQMLSERVHG